MLSRQTDTRCQCADPGCPACHGRCHRRQATGLHRIDMEDVTGTPMCRPCAEDALESGVFREEDNVEMLARREHNRTRRYL